MKNVNRIVGLCMLSTLLGCTSQKELKKYRSLFPVFIPVWHIIIMKENVEPEL